MVKSVYIIAEVGVNHNGDIELAKKMVEEAAKAGVNCVKFQTFKAEKLVSKYAKKAEYQKINMSSGEDTQLEMLKKLELSDDVYYQLRAYCTQLNVDFLSTPFDLESIDFLNQVGMSIWKVPSGEITNYPYLVKLASTGKPIVLSTGMSTIDEVRDAVNTLKGSGASDIILLHCNTEYPTPFEDVNLNAMNTLKREFGVEVGYSDHTQGIEVPIAAVAMGATIIEKHFTLDKNMEGPDHKASLEPHELAQMVKAIRNIERALGNGNKEPSNSEKKNMKIARKSIVAAVDIKKGEILTEQNIVAKRPGNGITPMKWLEVVGQVAQRDFCKDEMIEL